MEPQDVATGATEGIAMGCKGLCDGALRWEHTLMAATGPQTMDMKATRHGGGRRKAWWEPQHVATEAAGHGDGRHRAQAIVMGDAGHGDGSRMAGSQRV